MKYATLAAALITSSGLIYLMHAQTVYWWYFHKMFLVWLVLTLAYQLHSLVRQVIRYFQRRKANDEDAPRVTTNMDFGEWHAYKHRKYEKAGGDNLGGD